jgi:hypothetical protein
MMAPGIAGLIEDLRKAAAREWDDPDQLDADLRGMGSLAARLYEDASALEETGVHPKYPEVMQEAAADMAAIAEQLESVTSGGIMTGPPGSIGAIAAKLAAIVGARPDRKSSVGRPWVPSGAPLPGKPRTWPGEWRPPGVDPSSLRSTGDPGHRQVPAGHFPSVYGLRQPEPMSRREAHRRAKRARRKLR